MKEKSNVVIISCDNYDEQSVYEAVKSGMELLGGMDSFVKPNEKLLIKPNLLKKSEVDRAVITHPSVISAVLRLVAEAGIEDVSLGDSCGFGSSMAVIKEAGINEAAERYGVKLLEFSEGMKVDYPKGKQAKSFVIAKEVLDADAIFSVCKMKTHALERLTGAVKNSYGYIYGASKALGHTRYPSPDSFARMLVDLNEMIRARLFIMDGIVAMEGNGPGSGDPVPMNVILMSKDPVALDAVFAGLVHADPKIIPTNHHGDMMGLGTSDFNDISVITPKGEMTVEEAVEKYGNPNFNVRRESEEKGWLERLTGPLNAFKRKPYVISENCVKCGICVECCPVEGKALDFKNGRKESPVYDYRKCIRCFCCQEMCPEKAIALR